MAEPGPRSLAFLTWNLALLERSAEAPASWGQLDAESAVRDVVLEIEPDIVLLQELPGLVPYVETHGMIPANPRSHSGNLATLVTHELLADSPRFATVDGTALMVTFDRLDLTVANVHLAPGRQGRAQRLTAFEAIAVRSPTERLIVAGDTNTRAEELDALIGVGLVAPQLPAPTWDSRRNRFRSHGPRFRASFTRYLVRGQVIVSDVAVHDRPIVTADTHRFHLSDHYALSATATRRGNGVDQK